MPPSSPAESLAELIEKLSAIETGPSQREFISEHPQIRERNITLGIADAASKMAREDLARAERLADAASWLADVLNDDFCRARSARAVGNVEVLRGKNAEALQTYQKSADLFRRLGDEVEFAITLSSSLQPLMYLGKYTEAFDRAQKARTVFEQHSDTLRLARLDVNLGNILHRQDWFEDALVAYGRALQSLEQLGQRRDCAVVWANMAVCYISVNNFQKAKEAYGNSRSISEQENMPALIAQADYNIAYLYYLHGEHTQAFQLYKATREYCARVGDNYHGALCDLDQAEMYLELHLVQEAAQLAQQAFSSFEEIGMGYEASKALVFLGIAAHQEHKAFRALELLAKAQDGMRLEQNAVWVAVLDLYQALILHHEGRTYEARRACKRAKDFFSSKGASGKSILTDLLDAVLLLEAGNSSAAMVCCQTALEAARKLNSPSLSSQGCWVRGRIQESVNSSLEAFNSYGEALAEWEAIPGRLQAEELKIPFVRDDLALYEALVSLGAHLNNGPAQAEGVLEVIEKAKSRELAETVAYRAHSLPAPSGTRSGLVEQVKILREELNWYYRQVDLAEFRPTEGASDHAHDLRKALREREEILLKTMGELRVTDEDFHALQNASITPLSDIRRILAPDEILVEFFSARGVLYVCLLERDGLQVIPLTHTDVVRDLIRGLNTQFSKVRLGAHDVSQIASTLIEGTHAILRDFHSELIQPIREKLEGKRLIIVPDGPLHYLPFYALFDGSHYLAETNVISYAGSASLYYLSAVKKVPPHGRDLIFSPEESQSNEQWTAASRVSRGLPEAQMLSGAEADKSALEMHTAGNRFIHMAAEMRVRQDNPIFSVLSFGNSSITILDSFHLRLPCELMGLSGTGPGLRSSGSGEEIHLLARGLEYAGARALLMPLWNTQGEPLGMLLETFYHRADLDPDKGKSLQAAMADVRKEFPHPFHWAPFILRGWTGRSEPNG